MIFCQYCQLPHSPCPWVVAELATDYWTALWPRWYVLVTPPQFKMFTTFYDTTYMLRIDPVRCWLTLTRVGTHWNTILHEEPTTPSSAQHIQEALEFYVMYDLL